MPVLTKSPLWYPLSSGLGAQNPRGGGLDFNIHFGQSDGVSKDVSDIPAEAAETNQRIAVTSVIAIHG